MEYTTNGLFCSADIRFKEGLPNINEFLSDIATYCNLSIVCETKKKFSPGETILYILSESHLALHTYPEHNFLAIDIFTCGKAGKPQNLLPFLLENKDSYHIETINRKETSRGIKGDKTIKSDFFTI